MGDYKLLQAKTLETDCTEHSKQSLIDLYNSDTWKMELVAVDKIEFTCMVCNSKRVYQLL